MRKNISLKWLEKNLACGKACQRFEKMFGQITTVKEVVDALHKLKRDDWEGWLLAQEPSLTTTMLKHGADIHADNDHVIRWAVLRGSFKVVELLLKHGADIHVSNDYALRVAAARGYTRIANLLRKSV
ncbi:MAG TPA: ankyrin repeat domain-containing protein [Candidatus Paceibacterota bacterium]|nr:ankyrin repeat domain-containing protein [Candidatus Paceibacterota bacterium]